MAKRASRKRRGERPEQGAGSRRVGLVAGLLLGLAVVVTAVHWPALDARAISFDDHEYLVRNRLVLNPSLNSAWRFLSEVLEPSTVHGYYQPLTMISLMLDTAMGGSAENLRPYHRTSLLLHAVNAALVAGVLYRLFGNVWAACLVALLFGVHPMTVEPIPWIGERKTLLAACFAFGSILTYLEAARLTPDPAAPARRRKGKGRRLSPRTAWLGASVGLYLLALLSKPTSLPLPVCLLLLDYWPLARIQRRAILEKIPYVVLAALFAVITYESQRRTAIAVSPGEWGDPMRIPYIIAHNIIFYPATMLWPVNLSSHYPVPSPLNLTHTGVLVGVIGTIVLIPALLCSLMWTRSLLTGWLFFFIAIFPTLGVIGFTNVIASDKYAYLPVLGFLMPLCYWLGRLLDGSWLKLRDEARYGIAAGLLVVAAVESAATRSYLQRWRDTRTLYEYMHALAPESVVVNINLGLELARLGDVAGAMRHYEVAMRNGPEYEGGPFNMGSLLLDIGQPDKAIPYLERAIALNSRVAVAHNNLGSAYLAVGRTAEAIERYREAVRLEREYVDARYNLANVYAQTGQPGPAEQLYREALALDPRHVPSHKNYGALLLSQGRIGTAIDEYETALRLRPEPAVARALSALYLEPGTSRHVGRAVERARYAVQLTAGRDAAALGTLAIALRAAGQAAEAETIARQAIALARSTGQEELAREIELAMSQTTDAPSQ